MTLDGADVQNTAQQAQPTAEGAPGPDQSAGPSGPPPPTGAPPPGPAPGPTRRRPKAVVACPQDVLLASVTLALTLTKGRSQYEVETLINLFSLTTDNLQAILAQMLINDKVADNLEVVI